MGLINITCGGTCGGTPTSQRIISNEGSETSICNFEVIGFA